MGRGFARVVSIGYFTRAAEEAWHTQISEFGQIQEIKNLPTREQSGVVVASVSGRIDHTSSEAFEKSLQPLMAAGSVGRSPLLLAFSAVTNLSESIVINMIKYAYEMQENDGRPHTWPSSVAGDAATSNQGHP
ncbi:STAS domain-containing protein [Dechloromonas sp.]|uniref:STAS domain-containing protein n=1 Tax=Dechloromonas sp. TaxID=1917218 RepID=UPI00345F485D